MLSIYNFKLQAYQKWNGLESGILVNTMEYYSFLVLCFTGGDRLRFKCERHIYLSSNKSRLSKTPAVLDFWEGVYIGQLI